MQHLIISNMIKKIMIVVVMNKTKFAVRNVNVPPPLLNQIQSDSNHESNSTHK